MRGHIGLLYFSHGRVQGDGVARTAAAVDQAQREHRAVTGKYGLARRGGQRQAGQIAAGEQHVDERAGGCKTGQRIT
ncbi:hypothetical protein [Janthinobacterium sp.]|uniref:hypothetical protein n=1 Tax=Janthinobacterium sp. TaxID=1871054 RepID=UPI00262F3CB4|nr:hypothetical protein [Janthinobacterium sp.]